MSFLIRGLSVLVVAAGLFSAGPALAQSCGFNGQLQMNPEQLAESEPVQGDAEADLVLVEFFDPNCPHCQDFLPVMDQVMEQYGDQVRYYKQPVPLWEFSRPQVRAILLAKQQGKYYDMIDAQLQSPHAGKGGMTTDQIVALSEEIGIDGDWMEEKLSSGARQEAVNRLPYEARKAGVQSTPTLAIGQKVVGNRSADCIGQLIEQELSASAEAASGS
ncbi:MAG: thioredoxin domain-containing protein [Salinibacter sp.]